MPERWRSTKSHGHTASHRSRSGPVRRRVRERPYVWGGRAGFGFDFSGFTSTIYPVYGITLPRDAGPQAADSQGRPVDKSAFQPGDLLFYSHGSRDPDNPDAIYHVAMYSGNGDMIEAFDSATPVRITPVRLDADYWGARRYLDQPR